MDLSRMMRLVCKKWPWTTERYPEMPTPGSARKRFQRRHVLWHMLKQIGHLAAIEERLDHDPASSSTARTDEIVKLLINTLQLARVEGMSPARLASALEQHLDTTPV